MENIDDLMKEHLTYDVLNNMLTCIGMTYREIGNKYGYNERKVSALAKKYNIPKNNIAIRRNSNKNRVINFSADEIKQILNMYEIDKISSIKISKKFKCSKSVILDVLHKEGAKIREAHDNCYYGDGKRKVKNKKDVHPDRYITLDGVRVHRDVFEKYHGITLSKENHIHHINFDKHDNSLENLYMFEIPSQHMAYHQYVKYNQYISPEFFVSDIYPKTYGIFHNATKEELTKLLKESKNSVNQMSQKHNVSRNFLEEILKRHHIKYKKRVNQYDAF